MNFDFDGRANDICDWCDRVVRIYGVDLASTVGRKFVLIFDLAVRCEYLRRQDLLDNARVRAVFILAGVDDNVARAPSVDVFAIERMKEQATDELRASFIAFLPYYDEICEIGWAFAIQGLYAIGVSNEWLAFIESGRLPGMDEKANSLRSVLDGAISTLVMISRAFSAIGDSNADEFAQIVSEPLGNLAAIFGWDSAQRGAFLERSAPVYRRYMHLSEDVPADAVSRSFSESMWMAEKTARWFYERL
jgi:hypothetical protein